MIQAAFDSLITGIDYRSRKGIMMKMAYCTVFSFFETYRAQSDISRASVGFSQIRFSPKSNRGRVVVSHTLMQQAKLGGHKTSKLTVNPNVSNLETLISQDILTVTKQVGFWLFSFQWQQSLVMLLHRSLQRSV